MMAPLCRHCGEPIGVYEPLVVIVEGLPRTTSRAAEPEVATLAGEHYHLTCHARGQPGAGTDAEHAGR